MKKSTLYALWGCMFLLCGLLGLWEEPSDAIQTVMTALSLLFFCPPTALLYRARQEQDWKTYRMIRRLSVLSLSLSAILIMVNILSVLGTDTLGVVLNVILSLVSAPMLCCKYWVISLFGWACLLVVSNHALRQHGKSRR